MPTRRLVLLLFLALLAWPSAAGAGTYDVYSCRLPNGEPTGIDGWVPIGINAYNDCGPMGGLAAQLPVGTVPPETASGWRFAAPLDARIAAFTIYRAAEAGLGYPSARDYFSSYDEASPHGLTDANPDYCASYFASCTGAGVMNNPLAPGNKVERSGLAVRSLTYQIMCWNFGSPGGAPCPTASSAPGRLRIFSSRFRFADDFKPAFEGDLTVPADGAVQAGPLDAVFGASDRGGGVARTWTEVDGVRQEERAVDPTDVSCAPPFTEVVPCSRRVTATTRLDALKFGEGEHRFRIGIADAAGNETVSREFTLILAPSPQALNGHGASRAARLATWLNKRRRSVTVAYRTQPTLHGTLLGEGGVAIAGATLNVVERVTGTEQWRSAGSVVTGGSGEFSRRLSRGPNRIVRVQYTAVLTDAQPSAYADVNIRARAGVTLNVSRKHVRNGSRLRFSGRVQGEVGSRRALVTIYALTGGPRKRIPVETLRARRDGRFSYAYRFTSIPGPSTYRFEARVPKQTGFPYLEGASRPAVVQGGRDGRGIIARDGSTERRLDGGHGGDGGAGDGTYGERGDVQRVRLRDTRGQIHQPLVGVHEHFRADQHPRLRGLGRSPSMAMTRRQTEPSPRARRHRSRSGRRLARRSRTSASTGSCSQFNPVNNYPGRRFLYDLGQLGTTPFELTGDHTASATPGVAWQGGGQGIREQHVMTRATFGSLAGYAGDAGQLSYTIGCQPAEGCALGTNGINEKASINLVIFSATVTVNDPTKPTIDRILASGLAVGGVVGGDEPLAFDATDNSGIKSRSPRGCDAGWARDAGRGAQLRVRLHVRGAVPAGQRGGDHAQRHPCREPVC